MPNSDTPPLARSIGRSHKVVRAWCDRQLAELDASVTDWIVLFNIATAPDPGLSQSDVARFSALGVPALNFGPGDPSLAHTRDEHVPIAQIESCEARLREWLRG